MNQQGNIYKFFIPQLQNVCSYQIKVVKQKIIVTIFKGIQIQNSFNSIVEPDGVAITTTLILRNGEAVTVPILCGHFSTKYNIVLKNFVDKVDHYSIVLSTSHPNFMEILNNNKGYIFDGPWDHEGKHYELDYVSQAVFIIKELRSGVVVHLEKIRAIFNCGIIVPAFMIINELQNATTMYPKFIEYLLQATRICPDMAGVKNLLVKLLYRTTLDGSTIMKNSLIGTVFDAETCGYRGAVVSPLSPFIFRKNPRLAFELLDKYYKKYTDNKLPLDPLLVHEYAMLIYNGVGTKKNEIVAQQINKISKIPLKKYNTSLLGAIGISFLYGSAAFAGLYVLSKFK